MLDPDPDLDEMNADLQPWFKLGGETRLILSTVINLRPGKFFKF